MADRRPRAGWMKTLAGVAARSFVGTAAAWTVTAVLLLAAAVAVQAYFASALFPSR